MDQRITIYLQSRGQIRRKTDIFEAKQIMISDPESTAIFVSTGRGQNSGISLSLEAEADKPFGTNDPETKIQLIPALGFMGDGRKMVSLVSIHGSRRVLYLNVTNVGEVEFPWPNSAQSISLESICSMSNRSLLNGTNLHDATLLLIKEINDSTNILLNSEHDRLTKQTQKLISIDETAESRMSIHRETFEARSRIHTCLMHLTAYDASDNSFRQLLLQTVGNIDSLMSAASGAQMLSLHERALAADDRLKKSEELEAAREKRLTRIAFAFLFPTIWLTFLGINTLPAEIFNKNINSSVSFVSSIAVTVAMIAIGLIIPGILDKNRKKKDKIK